MYTRSIKNYRNGFTLIELLVTIAIVGIVMSIAIPNFTETIRSSRLTTNANEFVTSLNIAKSEAIKRGVQITILRSGATAAQWEDGWSIFVDINGTEGFVDDGDTSLCEVNSEGIAIEDCLLKTYSALSSGFTLRTGGSTYQNYIAYTPTGMSTVSIGDTFRLCDSSADNTKSRAIIINSVGRSRVQDGTTACP